MRARLLSTARRLGHGPLDAEDLVQDTFTAALRGMDNFRADATLETWVYTIFLRKNVDHYRKKKRQLPFRRGESADPVDLAVDHERHNALRRAITSLPGMYQMVLIHRYVEDRSYHEIADLHGVPVGTLRSRMCEALKRLRSLVEDYQ